jgi:GT2 family glycosyltransferase
MLRNSAEKQSVQIGHLAMAVSVVVPTWRRAAWLERCLNCLIAQRVAPREVLVVGRRDDTDARDIASAIGLKAPFRLRWLEVERSGHIAPVMLGLEEASGDVVAFLDDDTEPAPGWLAALLAPFSDKQVGCVGGRVVTPGFPPGKAARDAGEIRWYGQHSANLGAREGMVPVPVDGVMEGNWAWRRPLLKMLEFDPVLDFDHAPMYGLDLCLQADRRGFRTLYQPSALVIHKPGPRDPDLDRADIARRTRAYSRNYTYVILKHLSYPRKFVYLAWSWLVGERGSYGLLLIPIDLLSRRRGVLPMARASFAGRWDGIRAWRNRARTS